MPQADLRWLLHGVEVDQNLTLEVFPAVAWRGACMV